MHPTTTPSGFAQYAEAILQSETFRNAPTSRRLLKFFVDRLQAGETDPVKEYTIGVEAFAKAADYDPRLDSTVRIQMGRLRQKLAEYYEREGQTDPLIFELPKGKLKLVCLPRETGSPLAPEPEPEAPSPTPGAGIWKAATIVLGVALLVVVAGWVAQTRNTTTSPALSSWPPELEEFWRPMIKGGRPLLIAVGDPLFAQFKNKTLFRDPSVDQWEDLRRSGPMTAAGKAFGTEAGESRPIHYYAAVGDVNSAFLLGQRLGPHQRSVSLVRSSQLLWQQMAEAHVLFLGPPRFFGERIKSLPMKLAIEETPDGFRVLQPATGEQATYAYREPAGYFSEDGEAHVLVSRVPGPGGSTEMLIFASNSTFGRLGAVDALTSPGFAKLLADRLRPAGQPWPRSFQILLRVRYKGGVPTDSSYVLHRVLQ